MKRMAGGDESRAMHALARWILVGAMLGLLAACHSSTREQALPTESITAATGPLPRNERGPSYTAIPHARMEPKSVEVSPEFVDPRFALDAEHQSPTTAMP